MFYRFVCSLFSDLFSRKRSRALPVRKSILRSLLLFLREITSKEKQSDCIERIHRGRLQFMELNNSNLNNQCYIKNIHNILLNYSGYFYFDKKFKFH